MLIPATAQQIAQANAARDASDAAHNAARALSGVESAQIWSHLTASPTRGPVLIAAGLSYAKLDLLVEAGTVTRTEDQQFFGYRDRCSYSHP